jgi:hypothetical protein
MPRRQPAEDVTAGTPRHFIKVWQESSSVAEVAQKVRSNKNACRVRAYRYRQLGVPLKEIPTSPPCEPLDWDELAEYAASLLPEAPEDAEENEEGQDDGENDSASDNQVVSG